MIKLNRLILGIFLLSIILSGCINDNGTNHVEDNKFLLIEAISYEYTELISGNYTDGFICSDFPLYSIDENNKSVTDYEQDEFGSFKVVYGSGSYHGGFMESGAGTRLKYINVLPFNSTKKIFMGEKYIDVSILVTTDLKVYINDSYLLSPGESLNYSYDVERNYQNHYSDEICVIRYYGVTKITNYGIWDKSQIR